MPSLMTGQSQYEKALELFRSYEEQYGQDEKADHEIAFLVTR